MVEKIVKTKKKERTRQKILETAISILAKSGFEHTSFQKIADQCDLTQQGVLVHFKNKDELFLGILEKIQVEMYKNVDTVFLSTDSCVEKLEKHFETNFQVVRTNPERMQVFIMLYYYASFNIRYQKIYRHILDKVHARLISYLKVKNSQLRFKLPLRQIAEIFHAHLIGFLINFVATEQTSEISEKEVKAKVRFLISSFIVIDGESNQNI